MSKVLWRVATEELAYVRQAIEGGLTGEFTKRFESRFAQKFKSEYAVAVNSGTSALHAAMAALDIGPGDEVIVPPLTFIATSFAPLYVGAIPVFADVDPQTFTIDPNNIRKKITAKTKAIITVSLYGLSPDMDAVMAIALEYGLKVVEDNAQCFWGSYKGKIVGTSGHVSVFSLQRSKQLTSGDGGIAITNDENIAEKIRKFSDLGYKTLTAKPISNENFKETIQQPNFERHELVGYNFRLPEVCAAIALAQLEKLDIFVKKRIDIGLIYAEAVRGCEWLTPQRTPEGIVHTYWAFVAKLEPKQTNISWSEFRKAFLERGGDRFYGAWGLSYLEPALKGKSYPDHHVYYERGLCPVAESLQPYLIQFKTNFETLEYAQNQANILRETIRHLPS